MTPRAAATTTASLGRSVRRWTRRYGALIRAGWLVDIQYRAAIAIWLIWGVLEPIIALGIWWSIARHGAVQGYDQDDFARYFFAVTLISQFTVAWDSWYIDRWIRQGEMNFRLTRPLAPVHEAIADNIAYKARTATIVLATWLIAALIWPAVRISITPGRLTLAMIAVILAAGIRFFNGYATGLLAFWTTRATALAELQFGVSLFLSGRIAPLTLLPAMAQRVAGGLWFQWMLAFPVELLTNPTLTPATIARGFVMQTVWLAVWWAAYRIIWWRGLRRYAAVGG